MLKMLRAVDIGIRRRWLSGIRAVFAVMGAVWLVGEISNYLFPDIQPWFGGHNVQTIQALLIVSLLVFVGSTYEPRFVSFIVPTTSCRLSVKFGNLFSEKGDLVISVNEFFDGELGNIVSDQSVHGQFIVNYFGSNSNAFRNVVDPLLSGYQGEQITRSVSPNIKYPIGTTIKVPIGNSNAFLVALSRTDLNTHKAVTTVSNFWTAVTNVLETIHHLNNANPVFMPLIGNGRASLNLQPQHILRLLVLAIVDTARRMQLPDSVTIVLPDACFEYVDLREISKAWRI